MLTFASLWRRRVRPALATLLERLAPTPRHVARADGDRRRGGLALVPVLVETRSR